MSVDGYGVTTVERESLAVDVTVTYCDYVTSGVVWIAVEYHRCSANRCMSSKQSL